MLLEMKDIVKVYGQVVANDHVSFSLDKGEILAVVGENGAGKSTIMKVLYGMEKATSGEIFLNGEKMHFRSPADAIAKGIGMVQQHFMLFQTMTVAENIVYRNEKHKGIFYDKNANNQIVSELAKTYGLQVDPKAVVHDLPVGTQQRVEILKILYQNADIIIFDEPSAVLTPLEVDELLKTMRKLADMGKSLIIITHKLREVMEIADRVVVMRAGKVVGETKKVDTSIEQLSYMMVGRQILTRQIPSMQAGERLLDVQDIVLQDNSGKNILDQLSIHVDRGEIVGIAGVSGNGQSELVRCVSGLQKVDSGKILLQEKDVTNASVRSFRDNGMSCIPEDRYFWGSAPEATLEENSLMGYEDKEAFSHKGLLDLKQVKAHAQQLIEDYKVKVGSPRQKIRELSGGNAQKLIAAREITLGTPFLIACEPTRGIDIGAMDFIHDRLVEKRNQGDGILLVSSELSEIMTLSDRIYVIYEGRINGEFVRGDIDEKSLGLLMVGGHV